MMQHLYFAFSLFSVTFLHLPLPSRQDNIIDLAKAQNLAESDSIEEIQNASAIISGKINENDITFSKWKTKFLQNRLYRIKEEDGFDTNRLLAKLRKTGQKCQRSKACKSQKCWRRKCVKKCKRKKDCRTKACGRTKWTKKTRRICCPDGKLYVDKATRLSVCGDQKDGQRCFVDKMCRGGLCLNNICSNPKLDGNICELDKECVTSKCAQSIWKKDAPTICCIKGISYYDATSSMLVCGSQFIGAACFVDQMCEGSTTACVGGICKVPIDETNAPKQTAKPKEPTTAPIPTAAPSVANPTEPKFEIEIRLAGNMFKGETDIATKVAATTATVTFASGLAMLGWNLRRIASPIGSLPFPSVSGLKPIV